MDFLMLFAVKLNAKRGGRKRRICEDIQLHPFGFANILAAQAQKNAPR
ncbi:MAG: hypothetical protein NW215_12245 [Hyphomicrobiales bacterium]|nr:hypothetical protein [Hyphomicrobiales bacterium]